MSSALSPSTSLILAPMAGYTNHPFRLLCRKYGAGVVETEMVSAEGLCHGNKLTERLARVFDDERPAGIQLWGNDPKVMGDAAGIACDAFSPDIIDINAGCPTSKVVLKEAGCALINDRERLCGMVSRVSDAVDGRAKVWVKTRLLPDASSMGDLAQSLKDAGADSLTLHARVAFRERGYSAPLREDIVKEVIAKDTGIPIVWNGGIRSLIEARGVSERTGCSGVMIARAALGNPFVFSDDDGGVSRPWDDRVASFREFVELCKSDCIPFKDVKAHAVFFPRLVNGAARMRNEVCNARDLDELLSVFG